MSNPVQLFDHRGNPMSLRNVEALEKTIQWQAGNMTLLTERLADLELAMEDAGWRQLVVGGEREFTRAGLADIIRLSRLMFLKNPLIQRGVKVQSTYVWGRGVNIAGRDERVNAVVQDFLDDPKNQAELTSHQARTLKEIDLQVLGNIFFVFFTNSADGKTTVRTLPADEIYEIIFNPDDARDPWFYKRSWNECSYDEGNGARRTTPRVAYYPDWSHTPNFRPSTLYGKEVRWGTPIFHIKVGGLSDMSMGVPETYAAIDWARAYKEFLEDWCSLMRAYARFAWRMETSGGQRGVAAGKLKFGTTLVSGGANETTVETNPAPVVGSMFIGGESTKLEPIKTAGATTSGDDARRVLLMVAAAMGLPETFFGDANVGNHATAKTLDRPTELKFLDRQTLWAEVLRRILDYVVDRAAAAPAGPLRGKILVKNVAAGDDSIVPLRSDPKAGEEVDRYIEVSFPALLEHDVTAQVGAIIDAATLKGKPLAGTMDLKSVAKMLLQELGATDIDELLEEMFPEGEEPITGKPLPDAERHAQRFPAPPPEGPGPQANPALNDDLAGSATAIESRAMREAVRGLRNDLMAFVSKYGRGN